MNIQKVSDTMQNLEKLIGDCRSKETDPEKRLRLTEAYENLRLAVDAWIMAFEKEA